MSSRRFQAVVHQPLTHSPALAVLAGQLGELDVQLQEELAYAGVLSVHTDREVELWVGVDQRTHPSKSASSSKVIVVLEPPDIKSVCVDGFDLVLTWHAAHLRTLPAAHLFIPTAPWLVPAEWPQFHHEAKHCSLGFLRGTKRHTEGHRLRHQVWDCREELFAQMQVDTKFLAGGVTRDERNHQFFCQFVLVIENSRHENYFTEKLLDALLARCVPVYWGCTNLCEFFDTAGIIELDGSIDEVFAACRQLTAGDYAIKAAAVEKNFQLAQAYAGDFGRRVQGVLEDCLLRLPADTNQAPEIENEKKE